MYVTVAATQRYTTVSNRQSTRSKPPPKRAPNPEEKKPKALLSGALVAAFAAGNLLVGSDAFASGQSLQLQQGEVAQLSSTVQRSSGYTERKLAPEVDASFAQAEAASLLQTLDEVQTELDIGKTSSQQDSELAAFVQFQKDLDAFRSVGQRLQSKVDKLSESVTQLESKLAAEVTLRRQAQQEAASLRTILTDTKAQFKEASQQLEGERSALKKELDAARNSVQSLQSQVDQFSKSAKETERKLAAEVDNGRDLRAEASSLRSELARTADQLQSATKRLQANKQAPQRAASVSAPEPEALQRAEKALDGLFSPMNAAALGIVAAGAMGGALYLTRKDRAAQETTTDEELTSEGSAVSRLQLQVTEASSTVERERLLAGKFEEQLEQLQSEAERLRLAMSDAEVRIGGLTRLLLDRTRQREQLTGKLAAAQQDLNKVRREAELLRRAIADAEGRNAGLIRQLEEQREQLTRKLSDAAGRSEGLTRLLLGRTEQREQLTSKLATAQQELNRVQREAELLRRAEGRSAGLTRQLEEQLEQLQSEAERLRGAMSDEKERNAGLTRLLLERTQQREKLTGKLAGAQQDLNKAQREAELLRRAMRVADERVAGLTHQLEEQREQLTSNLSNAEVRNAGLTRLLLGRTEQREQLTSKLAAAQQDLSKVQREAELLRRAMRDAEARIAGLTRQLEEQREQLQVEADRLRGAMSDAEVRIAGLTRLLLGRTEQREQLTSKLGAAQQDLKKVSREAELLRRAMTDAEGRVAGLTRQLEEQREQLTSKLGDAALRSGGLTRLLLERTQQREQLTGKLVIAQQDLKKAQREAELQRRAVNDAEGRVAGLTRQQEQLTSELAAAQQDLNKVQSEAEQLRGAMSDAAARNAGLTRLLLERIQQREQLTSKLVAAQQDLNKVQNEAGRLRRELSVAEGRNAGLARQMEDQREQLMSKLGAAHDDLKKTRDELETEAAGREDATAAVSHATATVSQLKDVIDAIQSEVAESESALISARQQLEEERRATLNDLVSRLEAKLADAAQDKVEEVVTENIIA